MKRKLTATLLCIALVFIISGNVVQAMSIAPAARYDDLKEYRWNTYFRPNLPAFFVKWDNISWLGEFGSYITFRNPPYTYRYHVSGDDSLMLNVIHDEFLELDDEYIDFYADAPVVNISDEMTSMLNAPPQNTRFKIVRAQFEYHYIPSGELNSIVWRNGTASLTLYGDLEGYVDGKNSIIGKLLSVSSIDFAVAWIVIVWNLIFTPLETALLFAAVAGIISVIVIKRKRKKKFIVNEYPPE